jgi:hypothetical protein
MLRIKRRETQSAIKQLLASRAEGVLSSDVPPKLANAAGHEKVRFTNPKSVNITHAAQ